MIGSKHASTIANAAIVMPTASANRLEGASRWGVRLLAACALRFSTFTLRSNAEAFMDGINQSKDSSQSSNMIELHVS